MLAANIYPISSFAQEIPSQNAVNEKKCISEFVTEFLKISSADRRIGTMKIYKAALNKFVAVTNNIPLDEITARHFDQYKSIRASEVSPITVNIELRSLRAAIRTAVRWKYLTSNPFEDTRLIPIPQTEKPFISQNDFPKLITTIREPWLKDLVLFAALTGLRREELICLTKENYDAENNNVIIKSSKNFQSKNGKIRVVPLEPTAQYIIQSRLALNKSEYVFYLEGGTKISGDYLTHKFKTYVRLIGLPDDIRVHSLRHCYGSWLAQNGTSLFVIQKLLGHGSIATTQIYAHLSVNELRSGVMNLPNFKDLYSGPSNGNDKRYE